jgi:hypothetical protein
MLKIFIFLLDSFFLDVSFEILNRIFVHESAELFYLKIIVFDVLFLRHFLLASALKDLYQLLLELEVARL